MNQNQPDRSRPDEYRRIDKFDYMLGQLHGLPDVVQTKPTTIRAVTIVGTQTFIVQTVRQRDTGDTVFLEHVDETGTTRMVIPPNVTDVIARQRDTLATQVRRRVGKALAAQRLTNGHAPGFTPEMRAKAAATRRANAAKRRARKARTQATR
jgi:hypothetical protein